MQKVFGYASHIHDFFVMMLPMNVFYHLVVIFAAFGGFIVAFYINHKKSTGESLVCPLNSDCAAVIHSAYSTFLGFPVQRVGMMYYALIALGYGFFLVYPDVVSPYVTFNMLALTISAFLFSLYLTFIQAFNLRQWCTWCLTSAGICTVIFWAAIRASDYGFIDLLIRNGDMLQLLHFLGFAIGIGGATMIDVLFFLFLRDFRISEGEAEIIRGVNEIIWFALGIVIMASLGIWLSEQILLMTSYYLAKSVAIMVIIINIALLHLVISPLMFQKSFHGEHKERPQEMRMLRKLAFALLGVSVVSWYYAFAVVVSRPVMHSFAELLIIYATVIILGVAVSQYIEHSLSRRIPPMPQ